MNKIYILFLCLCYAVSAIMANTYKNDKEVTSPTDANIFGHVVDKATGEHLPGITIILKGTTIGSVTDDSGHYMLKNLPEGEFTIEVSFVGFKTVTKKVAEILEISTHKEEGKEKKKKKLTAAERKLMIEQLTKEMKAAAKLLEFEHAAFLRDKIKQLEGQK